ncbi:hypothetical protein RHMOL_Rhmol01G0165000 [Rhododendron molle]|uniref:Uncharacterized protein n=1 Tax=Rhododendron molle TaxID=49168 RepID=A0ACC0Q415_RHOML|nr:hypothetical protein RHMOL_Rhmol01G0165000 [Rhododendron molle]
MFDCHINIEVCSTIKLVKYLYKYIYKGYNKIVYRLATTNEAEGIDEIKQFQDAKWISPPEAMWRIYRLPLYEMRPAICHPECIKFKEKALPLKEEMQILFGSNTAIEDVSKKRRVDGSATKKGKGKKGTIGSRLEACMQQICDSNDSASSPSSVHRAAPDISMIKECSEKLSQLLEFDADPTLWAKAHNLFRDARTRMLFMTCPDEIRGYHFITQELQRVEIAELQKMCGGNWFNNWKSGIVWTWGNNKVGRGVKG